MALPHADVRAPRFVVDRAVGRAYAFLYPISGARDKCEALTVRDNRLLRLEFSLLLVSSFQDDALDASIRKVIVPEEVLLDSDGSGYDFFGEGRRLLE